LVEAARTSHDDCGQDPRRVHPRLTRPSLSGETYLHGSLKVEQERPDATIWHALPAAVAVRPLA
jgi:hypothetical protein